MQLTNEIEVCAICDYENTNLLRDKNTGLLICRQCKKNDVSIKRTIKKPKENENGTIV